MFPQDTAAQGATALVGKCGSPLISELAGHIRRIGWYDIGFPSATDLTYPELAELLTMTRLTNVGDPWGDGTIRHHTRVIEQQVVDVIGGLLGAPAQRWGYVTTGAAEGTEYALYEAARAFPDVVAYFSAAAHDWVPKLVGKLGLTPVQIRATATGHLDLNDLAGELRRRRDRAVLIVANAGTAWSEAVDDVAAINRTCQDLAITRLRIHVDAPLSGLPLALLPEPQRPPFGFAAGATSMVIAGDAFLGTLAPCGVLVFAAPPVGVARHPVPYAGTVDTTITAARSGHMPVVLWHQLTRTDIGLAGHRERAAQARALAAYLFDRLRRLGWDARYNARAFTVVLRKPPAAVRQRWSLAYEGEWARVVCMPGVRQDQIDDFLSDLEDALAAPAEPPWPPRFDTALSPSSTDQPAK